MRPSTVYTKALFDQRRGLLGWSIGVAATAALFVLIYPMVRDMEGIEVFLEQYPEAFGELFNIAAVTTGPGFLNAEFFSLLGPALFLIYGIGRGARAVAGEEEVGTLEVLLATPISRTRMLAEKALALLTGIAVLGLVLWATLVVTGPLVDLGLGVGRAAAASAALTLLGGEFGLLALAVGAVTGRRGPAIAAAGAAAVASYLLFALGALVEELEPWQALSPFQHAMGTDPILNGLSGGYTVAIVAVGLVAVVVSSPLLERRDIAA
jgi:ABC-2 type transport system permease protein